jgi:flagellar biogenesis protein FliO
MNRKVHTLLAAAVLAATGGDAIAANAPTTPAHARLSAGLPPAERGVAAHPAPLSADALPDTDRARPALKLSPPGTRANSPADSNRADGSRRITGFSVVRTTLTALAVTVGALLLLTLLLRRTLPAALRNLPPEVFEVLGRAQLAERQHVHLVRFGQRLLLVAVGPSGADTLSEINQLEEVQRLTAICAQRNPSSSTSSFRQIFDQFSREPSLPPRTSTAVHGPDGRVAGSGSLSHG